MMYFIHLVVDQSGGVTQEFRCLLKLFESRYFEFIKHLSPSVGVVFLKVAFSQILNDGSTVPCAITVHADHIHLVQLIRLAAFTATFVVAVLALD
jgi:hypothetical protein